MAKILVAEQLDQNKINILAGMYKCQIDFAPLIKDEELMAQIHNYDGIIVRNRVISKELLQNWRLISPKKALCITRAGSNTSTIDVAAATDLNIQVMNTPGANAFSVSQFIFAQLLYLAHMDSVSTSMQDLQNNIHKDKKHYKSHSLMDLTFALIGTGHIGQNTAQIANSFGVRVKAYSPSLTEEKAHKMGVQQCSSIEEALSGADILTLQVPFTKGAPNPTYHLINQDGLNLLNPGAYITNISRKDVIDMKALEASYMEQKFSGIVLDLLKSEIDELKIQTPNLMGQKNVLITPLIATETETCEKILTTKSIENTILYLKNDIEYIRRFFVNNLQELAKSN